MTKEVPSSSIFLSLQEDLLLSNQLKITAGQPNLKQGFLKTVPNDLWELLSEYAVWNPKRSYWIPWELLLSKQGQVQATKVSTSLSSPNHTYSEVNPSLFKGIYVQSRKHQITLCFMFECEFCILHSSCGDIFVQLFEHAVGEHLSTHWNNSSPL